MRTIRAIAAVFAVSGVGAVREGLAAPHNVHHTAYDANGLQYDFTLRCDPKPDGTMDAEMRVRCLRPAAAEVKAKPSNAGEGAAGTSRVATPYETVYADGHNSRKRQRVIESDQADTSRTGHQRQNLIGSGYECRDGQCNRKRTTEYTAGEKTIYTPAANSYPASRPAPQGQSYYYAYPQLISGQASSQTAYRYAGDSQLYTGYYTTPQAQYAPISSGTRYVASSNANACVGCQPATRYVATGSSNACVGCQTGTGYASTGNGSPCVGCPPPPYTAYPGGAPQNTVNTGAVNQQYTGYSSGQAYSQYPGYSYMTSGNYAATGANYINAAHCPGCIGGVAPSAKRPTGGIGKLIQNLIRCTKNGICK